MLRRGQLALQTLDLRVLVVIHLLQLAVQDLELGALLVVLVLLLLQDVKQLLRSGLILFLLGLHLDELVQKRRVLALQLACDSGSDRVVRRQYRRLGCSKLVLDRQRRHRGRP